MRSATKSALSTLVLFANECGLGKGSLRAQKDTCSIRTCCVEQGLGCADSQAVHPADLASGVRTRSERCALHDDYLVHLTSSVICLPRARISQSRSPEGTEAERSGRRVARGRGGPSVELECRDEARTACTQLCELAIRPHLAATRIKGDVSRQELLASGPLVALGIVAAVRVGVGFLTIQMSWGCASRVRM